MTSRESLDEFVNSVARVRATKRLRVFRDNVFDAARVPSTYENPLGILPHDVTEGLEKQVQRAEESFYKSEQEAVWNKLFRFLLED